MSDIVAMAQERRAIADALIPRLGGMTVVGTVAILGSVFAITGHSETAVFWGGVGFVTGDIILAWQVVTGHMAAARMLVSMAEAEVRLTNARADSMEGAAVVQVNENSGSGKQSVKSPIVVRHNNRIAYQGDIVDYKDERSVRVIALKDSDVFWMMERFVKLGVGRDNHLNQEFPWSRGISVTRPIHDWFLDRLTELDLLNRQGKGSPITLKEDDPKKLYRALCNQYREGDGFQIQLPARTKAN